MSKKMTHSDVMGTETVVPCKLKISVTGIPAEFKIVPHKTNEDLIVLKTGKSDYAQQRLAAFCQAAKIEVNNVWLGSHYCIVEVTKQALFTGLANVINGNVTVKGHYLPPDMLPAVLAMITGPDEDLPN